MDRKPEQNQTQLVDLQNYFVYKLGKEMDELFIFAVIRKCSWLLLKLYCLLVR